MNLKKKKLKNLQNQKNKMLIKNLKQKMKYNLFILQIPVGDRVKGGVDEIIPLNNMPEKNESNDESDESDEEAIPSNEIPAGSSNSVNNEVKNNSNAKTVSLDDLLNQTTGCTFCNADDHTIDNCPLVYIK